MEYNRPDQALKKGRNMGTILLIIIMIFLAAFGDFTLFWIFGGVIVLALIGSLFGLGKKKSVPHERPRTRVDIPHLYDADEYVCTICGHRFRRDVMSCPHCGVRFNTTKTDDRAFIDEEEFEDMMEELDEQ